MREILILSEGLPPDNLAGSRRWPGINVSVESGLSPGDIDDRLRTANPLDAVIVNANTPNASLAEALADLTCPSVEVQLVNPNRQSDGLPDLSAKPVGADAIIYGLGVAGFKTALSLLAIQLTEPAT